MKERISPKAFDLIVRFESGDRPYYEKRLKRPSWPGGRSGVTIGFGYDLGYETDLDSDWDTYLSEGELARLSRTLGKRGKVAQQALSGIRDIEIPWDWAAEVFNEKNLPREIRKTLATFPGSADKLPADAFGALVSLIFNRGTDLIGPRRAEMKMIRDIIVKDVSVESSNLVVKTVCERIAEQFREMKRLWTDVEESDGDLVDRREAEAKLIEQAIT